MFHNFPLIDSVLLHLLTCLWLSQGNCYEAITSFTMAILYMLYAKINTSPTIYQGYTGEWRHSVLYRHSCICFKLLNYIIYMTAHSDGLFQSNTVSECKQKIQKVQYHLYLNYTCFKYWLSFDNFWTCQMFSCIQFQSGVNMLKGVSHSTCVW